MTARVLALSASLLLGCNAVLGFGDPSLAPDADLGRPSCETGWRYRIPIELQNATTSELHGYQVLLHLDAPAGPDLRIMTDSGDGPLAHLIETPTSVWVNVPLIPVGTSRVHAYYGNPTAGPWITDTTFEHNIITNPSFEDVGGWTLGPSVGPRGAFNLQHPAWASDGNGSMQVNEEVTGERASTSWSEVSQPTIFPAGSNHIIRFDINVVAASNGGINGTNDGAFLLTVGNGINNVWGLSGDRGNITGVRLGEETSPIGPGSFPLTLRVSVASGAGPGYALGYLDNLRVRKHVSPEPTVQVGKEEPCSP